MRSRHCFGVGRFFELFEDFDEILSEYTMGLRRWGAQLEVIEQIEGFFAIISGSEDLTYFAPFISYFPISQIRSYDTKEIAGNIRVEQSVNRALHS